MTISFRELWVCAIATSFSMAAFVWLGWHSSSRDAILFCMSLLAFVGMNHLFAAVFPKR